METKESLARSDKNVYNKSRMVTVHFVFSNALRDAQKSHLMRFRAEEPGISAQNVRKHLAE